MGTGVGVAVTCFGLYLAGHALTADSTPYGLEPLLAIVCLLLGSGLVVAARRRLTRAAALLGIGAGLAALTAGLLQLPTDSTESGPLCRALNGNVYDCDDPRIDEPEEKAAVVPGSGR